jgi:hypothetical protein
MSNKPLYFELASIALLLAVGVFLLLASLPGWGLISIAGLLYYSYRRSFERKVF